MFGKLQEGEFWLEFNAKRRSVINYTKSSNNSNWKINTGVCPTIYIHTLDSSFLSTEQREEEPRRICFARNNSGTCIYLIWEVLNGGNKGESTGVSLDPSRTVWSPIEVPHRSGQENDRNPSTNHGKEFFRNDHEGQSSQHRR
jgi:hypothetical protein